MTNNQGIRVSILAENLIELLYISSQLRIGAIGNPSIALEIKECIKDANRTLLRLDQAIECAYDIQRDKEYSTMRYSPMTHFRAEKPSSIGCWRAKLLYKFTCWLMKRIPGTKYNWDIGYLQGYVNAKSH